MVRPGETPSCAGPLEAGSCPPSESAALLATCNDPGLSCPYPGGCAGAFDTCQCLPSDLDDGGAGLLFQCSPGSCPGDDGDDEPAEATSDSAGMAPSDSSAP